MPRTAWASTEAVRHVMQANRSRDTAPELKVRRLLHAAGLRYRVNIRPVGNLRRTADIVFTKKHVAVFIDGCFWHGCVEHYVVPKSNVEYWSPKIQANLERDADTTEKLREAGWTVLRYWEHQPPEDVAARVIELIREA